jgi:hypothetical protein
MSSSSAPPAPQSDRGLSRAGTRVRHTGQLTTRPRSMGPRPLSRGDVPTIFGAPVFIALQWDRGLSAAETSARPSGCRSWRAPFNETAASQSRILGDVHHPHVVLRPSMGPRPFGRGDSAGRTARPCSSYAFNGTAASQPRRLEVGEQALRDRTHLQWDRGLSAAETQEAQHRHQDREPPSMGPLPLSRGDGKDARPAR